MLQVGVNLHTSSKRQISKNTKNLVQCPMNENLLDRSIINHVFVLVDEMTKWRIRISNTKFSTMNSNFNQKISVSFRFEYFQVYSNFNVQMQKIMQYFPMSVVNFGYFFSYFYSPYFSIVYFFLIRILCFAIRLKKENKKKELASSQFHLSYAVYSNSCVFMCVCLCI